MSHPQGYVDPTYLQTAATLIRPVKQRTHDLMQLQPGHRALDVGCGPGADTIPLARLVGPTGEVVGIDHDPGMIAEADRRAAEAGVASWVTHQQADATALPLADSSFDTARSERLFQHLARPDLALAELIRVTRPGGWIVVLDTDTATVSVDSDEVDIERRLCRFYSDHQVRNGYAGRRLYRLCRRHGLTDMMVELVPVRITDYGLWRYIDRSDDTEQAAVAAGVLTPDELRRWHESLERTAADGFFASFSMVLVAGRKAGVA